jgi:glycosyltransferase involved in cell wall biosynthesis
VKFLGYVPMEDLVAIYNLASVYCQPSLYEGFGLQILEAMACGVPVITANVSSLPEVAGNAAVLVDPNDSKQLALNLQTVINDLTLRKKMIKLGFAQVKNFSWERTAQETLKIYEKILAS